ncbi:MAG: DUF3368 domain-containing protein [Bryobacteraceae bacterium]|nr:DUF3368 domain-containing protein [Bryobacteraceae bacterium]
MRIVVADTTPIRYLTEIDHLDVLPRLFKAVFIPNEVYEELQQPATPALTRQLLKSAPAWLRIEPIMMFAEDPSFAGLDNGEKAALMLGLHLNADLILMDERKGVAAALQKGLQTTGTLGVLTLAADSNLLDLVDAFTQLRQTNFYCPQGLMSKLLDEHRRA